MIRVTHSFVPIRARLFLDGSDPRSAVVKDESKSFNELNADGDSPKTPSVNYSFLMATS